MDLNTILLRPDNARLLYVFAHGAGADMHHHFMQDLSQHLYDVGVATLRFNFPYMDKQSKRPDPPAVAEGQVKKAIEHAKTIAGGIPIIAGGKSFGGRMTSQLLAKKPDDDVKGIVFVGFPLHQPGKPSTERATHLLNVRQPMLFLQGTRDSLANLEMIKEVVGGLPAAKLHIVDTADHSFNVLKKAGKSHDQVLSELAGVILRTNLQHEMTS